MNEPHTDMTQRLKEAAEALGGDAQPTQLQTIGFALGVLMIELIEQLDLVRNTIERPNP